MKRFSPKLRAIASRAAWAALWGALSTLTVTQLGLPLAYVPVASYVLSALKSYVASKVGDPDTVTFRKDA
jgi:hypothetical protein